MSYSQRLSRLAPLSSSLSRHRHYYHPRQSISCRPHIEQNHNNFRTFCSSCSSSPPPPSSPSKRLDNQNNKPNGPYVSKHFYLDENEVPEYLKQRDMNFRLTNSVAVVEHCPFCHDTRGLPDNLYKLNIFRDNGVYNCFRCSAQGSWFDFRNRLSSNSLSSSSNAAQNSQSNNALFESITTCPSLLSRDEPSQQLNRQSAPSEAEHLEAVRDLWSGKFPNVLNYLQGKRKLSEDTIRRFSIGAKRMKIFIKGEWKQEECIIFPMYNDKGKLCRFKIRSIHSKSGMQLYPKGGKWGLFGLNKVMQNISNDEVVITEGELDAMSVWQLTKKESVSLPNGASSLPIELIPMLESFKKILLWMDFDEIGQSNVKQFAKKLGIRRCFIVPPSSYSVNKNLKDANDFLQNDINVGSVLENAKYISHDGVIKFSDIRHNVYDHLLSNGDGFKCGFQLQSIPKLNQILKGHRRGELSILSGHTGIGKTTFLSQLSLDYCMQGVVTMWGSFEIPSVKLAACMLQQMHGSMNDGRGNVIEDFDEYADKLSELPLYFMKYHGSNSMDLLMDAMQYGNYVHDCSHFVLDNLQFMTYGQRASSSPIGKVSSMEKFEVMDEAVSRLRNICTKDNVHVTLVVHPRKEADDEKIQMASIFGSAKSIQEADNVLLMQRTKEGVAQLEVKKNRYDGELGKINLRFNRASKLFTESDKANCQMLMNIGNMQPASTLDETYDDTVEPIQSFTENVYAKAMPLASHNDINSEQTENMNNDLIVNMVQDNDNDNLNLVTTSKKNRKNVETKTPKQRTRKTDERFREHAGVTSEVSDKSEQKSNLPRKRLAGQNGIFKR